MLAGVQPPSAATVSTAGAMTPRPSREPEIRRGLADAVTSIGTTWSPITTIGTRPPTNIPPTAGGGGTPTPSSSQTVSGRIVLEHGLPASKVKVRIYQRGLGGATTLLTEVETTESGDYGVPLAGAANVEVHAVGADGREVQLSDTKLASSRKSGFISLPQYAAATGS